MNACPSCGTLNATGTTQCMRCGTILTQAPAAAPPPGADAGFGAPAAGGFVAPAAGGFVAPAAGGFGAPPAVGGAGGGFGDPPSGGPGFGSPPPGGFGGYQAAPVGVAALGYAGASPAPAARPPLDVGDVLRSAFDIWKANLSTILVIQAACSFPGWLVTTGGQVFQSYAMQGMANPNAAAEGLGSVFAGAGLTLVGALISVVAVSVAAGALTRVGLDGYARRQVPSTSELFSFGFGKMAPMLAITILVGLAVGVGFIFCCFPGVFLGLMFAVALPVCIAESKGAIDSIQRSSDLTDGSRVEIFLTYLAFVGVVLLLSVPVFCIVGAMTGVGAAAAGQGAGLAAVVVQQVWSFVAGLFLNTFAVILSVGIYVRLSGYGTTTDAASVAQVFR